MNNLPTHTAKRPCLGQDYKALNNSNQQMFEICRQLLNGVLSLDVYGNDYLTIKSHPSENSVLSDVAKSKPLQTFASEKIWTMNTSSIMLVWIWISGKVWMEIEILVEMKQVLKLISIWSEVKKIQNNNLIINIILLLPNIC